MNEDDVDITYAKNKSPRLRAFLLHGKRTATRVFFAAILKYPLPLQHKHHVA